MALKSNNITDLLVIGLLAAAFVTGILLIANLYPQMAHASEYLILNVLLATIFIYTLKKM